MPTIDDLRSALDALAEQAPTTGRAVRPRRRRRAPALAIASAAVAIAAVAAVPVLVTHGSRSSPTFPVESVSPAKPTNNGSARTTHLPLADPSLATLTFSVARVQNMSVYAWETGVGFERAFLKGLTHPAVSVYPPGGWAPTRPAGATDITLGTKPGFFGHVQHDGPDAVALIGENPMVTGDALAWQYEPGAWALVESEAPMTLQQMKQVAGAVDFDTRTAVTLPANFSYLPTDLDVKGITVWLPTHAANTQIGDRALTTQGFGPQVRLSLGKVGSAFTTTAIMIGIAPFPSRAGDLVNDADVVHVEVGDFAGTYNKSGFLQVGNGTTATVTIGGVGQHPAVRLSQAEALHVVKALGLIPQPGDLDGWLTVIPVSP